MRFKDFIISANTGLDAIKRAPIVDYDTGLKCIRIQDISQKKGFEDWGYTEVSETDYKKFKLHYNDILVARTGATVGVSYIVKHNYNAVYNNGSIRLRFSNDIDTDFVYYVLQTKEFLKYIDNVSCVATQPNLRIETLLRFAIPDYSLQQQIRIANVLSKYDELIEVNNQRIKKLEQTAEELYKEWFVRFRFPNYQNTEFENGIPKGWITQTLGEFGVDLESGRRPKGGIDDSLENGVPSLGAECINGLAEYDYNSTKYVPLEFFNGMKTGVNSEKDILLYKDGAYIGRITIFRNEFPFKNYSINEHVFFIKPHNEEYFNYLYFTLHQKAYFVLMQNLNRNAAQPGLSKPDINRIKMTIPTEDTVNKFNKIVDPILNDVFNIAKENRNLIKQRDYLLPRLMSGKLEV